VHSSKPTVIFYLA